MLLDTVNRTAVGAAVDVVVDDAGSGARIGLYVERCCGTGGESIGSHSGNEERRRGYVSDTEQVVQGGIHRGDREHDRSGAVRAGQGACGPARRTR